MSSVQDQYKMFLCLNNFGIEKCFRIFLESFAKHLMSLVWSNKKRADSDSRGHSLQ